MTPTQQRLKNLEQAVATHGYILARGMLNMDEASRLVSANAQFVQDATRLEKADEYVSALDEILTRCEQDPAWAAALRPQLEKLGELLGVATNQPA